MFFQFSPVRSETKHEAVQKENESEEPEVLSLAPFTPNPKLFFENVKVGTTVSRKLLIENPTNHDVVLFVTNQLPEELNVTLNPEQITIEKRSNATLELTWQPLHEEFSRHMITIQDGKRIHRDVPVAFKSILPKKSKTGTKVKRKAPLATSKQKSPTKKYYSTKPPNISPKKYSPLRKKLSPPRIRSPTKQHSVNQPEIQWQSICPVDDFVKKRHATYKGKGKENLPSSLLNASSDSTVFVSPSSATFRFDDLKPVERRETYVVNGKKDVSFNDSVFSDSLENISPDVSPHSENEKPNVQIHQMKKRPLGNSNQDNISPKITRYVQQKLANSTSKYNFEYKLMEMETFCFTPVRTPLKREKEFSPGLSSTMDKSILDKISSETKNEMQNKTFELPPKSPNISSETYVKSNISTETYVKDNTSFETYVKSNLSGGTFTKDTSVGDVANLSFSPVTSKAATSPIIPTINIEGQSTTHHAQYLNSDCVRQVIEANLWSGMRSQPLSSIQEESYIQESMREIEHTPKVTSTFLKRKSDLDFSIIPPKRPYMTRSPKEWSKTGGTAIRIAKKTTGLNLRQFLDSTSTKSDDEARDINVTLTKHDTNQVIVQNPFLLAATNLADPFMTPHLYVDEEWLDQQQIDFKKWLNALLTPPQELNSEEQVVDVAKVWRECKKREVEVAPTKELISSKYLVNNKLNSLRKSAQNLYRSKEMTSVLSKVVLVVETGKLMIREDKDVHLNLALKSEVISMLFSYNPLWLRIGLETIYNEVIPLKSNSDVVGLSLFIGNRLLKDPYLLKKHKLVHSPKYVHEFKKFFLKKFLVLVYFLDQAKNNKLIPHDPCLFCKNSTIKESKEMLIKLAREILAAVGDITKFLKYTGYVVTHVQTYINEFDYAVNNLGVDLRDGVRLTRVMEIILMQEDLTANLRVPAISRLQKIHNMKIVFSSLEKAGYQILYDISPKDIVDGHKEKTLSFLWQIVYKFQAPLMVKSATTIQTWYRSLPVVLKRRKLEKIRLRRQMAATKIQSWYRRQKLVKRLDYYATLIKEYLFFKRRERAIIKIQSYYRMRRCRKLYIQQTNTVLKIQTFARGWLVRNVRRNQIKKAVILQSYIRMYLARKRYLGLRSAVKVIQTKYRAKKQMEDAKSSYIQVKSSAIIIQRWVRAVKLLQKDKYAYQKLRTATLCIQHRFRANKLCKIERERYIEVRTATSRIQAWYRSVRITRIDRQQFLALKKSVMIIEQQYIAFKAMQTEKHKYQLLKKACLTIQQKYKAHREMKLQRCSYLKLKTAAITLQNRYRANNAAIKEKQRYEALRSATIFVQRKFRATQAMKIEYRNYNRLREAAIKIQVWFRSTIEMRKCLTYYISLKYAVVIFEDRYQAKKLMQKEFGYYTQLKLASTTLQRKYRALVSMRKARNEYLRLRAATSFIQRKYRANKMARVERMEYIKLKQATVVIQHRYKAQLIMRKCRKEYLNLKSATVTLQRQYRANCLMRTARTYYRNLLESTLTVQQRYRANNAMLRQREEYKQLRDSAVLIQQKWRAKKLGERQRRKYEELQKAVRIVQSKWRANKLCRQERTKYITLKKAVVNVQCRWRAKKLCNKQRSNYMRLKNATTTLQRAWRAKSLKEKHRKRYMELKTATIFLQRMWRSARLTEKQRTEFVTLKKTVTNIQQRWRANKLARKERESYLQQRNAAITIQQKCRARGLAKYHKNQYAILRKTTIFIQRRWRANKLAKQERVKYEVVKNAAVTIQSRWRSNKLAVKQRQNYLQLKSAAIVIQRRWRANVMGNIHRQEYEHLRKATVLIQRRWKANKLAKEQKIAYDNLRSKVVMIQRLYKANRLASVEKNNYLQLKSAVILIQNWWRAQRIGKQQKIQYELLRKSTLFIQRRWRANIIAIKERTRYLALQNTAITVQRNWRKKQARSQYLQLRKATISIQRLWRAKKLRNQRQRSYDSLRSTALFIQRRWRSKKLAQAEKQKFDSLKKAVVVLQSKWRAKKQTERDRNQYILMKKAAVCLQQRWRAKKICEEHKKEYELLREMVIMVQRRWRLKKQGELHRNRYLALKKATLIVQRTWRGKALAKAAIRQYTLLKCSTIKIQVWYKASMLMRKQREWYIKMRTSAVAIQKLYRSYVAMKQLRTQFLDKKKAVVELQRYIRGYLVRRKYAHCFTQEEKERRRIERIEKIAAIKIQAIWRGHRSRSLEIPELIAIRQRVKKANLKAEPQNTLACRCKVALQALVNEKSTVSSVNKALDDLDYITRHSRDVCQQVAQFLPEQMYLMIKTTNRSLPEMTACIYSVNILINVWKYPPTRLYSFFNEYIDNLITVMMHWCDKEAQLFPSICTLLWLFAHNPDWKESIKSTPNIEQRFFKIQAQVLRKQSMVKRTGVKGQSLFASYKTLPLPSLEPDWGLTYRHNPYIFSNSIHAFSSLLQILNL